MSIQLLLVALSQLMPKRMVRNDVKSFGVTTAEVYGVTVFVIWILALTNGFLYVLSFSYVQPRDLLIRDTS